MWLELNNTYTRVSFALKLIHAHCKTKCFGKKKLKKNRTMKNLIIQTLRNNAIKIHVNMYNSIIAI